MFLRPNYTVLTIFIYDIKTCKFIGRVFLWLWYFYLSTFSLIVLCHSEFNRIFFVSFYGWDGKWCFIQDAVVLWWGCLLLPYVCWLLLQIIDNCIIPCQMQCAKDKDEDNNTKGSYLIDLDYYSVWPISIIFEIKILKTDYQ